MTPRTPASGRYRRSIRLLVFDWDGTLVDSIASIVGCMHATTGELGLPSIPEETIRSTIGLGLRDTLEALLPEAGTELRQRVVACYRERWLGGWGDRHPMIRGARETLEALGREGYRLAVATGKSRAGLDRDLARFGVADLFLATRTPDEAPGKPHPGMVVAILEELGVAPAEALVVGDTPHDLRMAAGAGTPAVAVTSGSAGRDELADLRPLAVLDDVTHLPGWLNGG